MKPARPVHLAISLLALGAIILIAAWNPDLRSPPAAAPITAATDVHFSLPSGYYDRAVDIDLSTANPNAALYFTTDGSEPTLENGTRYQGPLRFPDGQPRAEVIRARTILPGGESGRVQSAAYFVGVDAKIPLVSLTIDTEDLWNPEDGIFANPFFHGRDWEREADLFLYDPEYQIGVQAPAGVRVHGGASRTYDKKSLRLYFRDEYGQPALDYALFPESDKESFKRLVIHDGGQDMPAVSVNATLLRNQLLGNLAREAGGYAAHSRPVLLFVNGEMWGIYQIRERIDGRYLQEEFGIEDADLLGGYENRLEAISGDHDNWDNLISYVADHDLAQDDAFAYVQTQVNLENLINYALIQIILANADWPRNNMTLFRDRSAGRWHWIAWDSDYAFGLLPKSNIEKDMFAHILDNSMRGSPSSLLFRKLVQNPHFRSRFLTRLADLLNTVLATENVLAEIDRLEAALETDIHYETRRWPGAGNWEASVEQMREFARQRPDIVRKQAIEAFDLDGTALLTINRPASLHGAIHVNDGAALRDSDLPWQGEYFQGTEVQVSATADPGYHFAGWELPEISQDSELLLTISDDLSLTPRFERDSEESPGYVKISGYGRDGDAAAEPEIEGEWISLQVLSPGGADLRGWRITDNDSITAADEGSLILADHPALASVPVGTTILLVITETPGNDRRFIEDDLSLLDRQLILYAGNDLLDTASDPWFLIGDDDSLVLLSPGPTAALDDDRVVDRLVVGH